MENSLVIQNNAQQMYTSLQIDNPADKVKLYNVMNNPDERLADKINEVISVKDIFVEWVECTNQETGEVTKAPRCILIDVDGKSFACTSIGIFSALQKLCFVFGEPTWEDGLPIKVIQVTKGKRKMLTLQIV